MSLDALRWAWKQQVGKASAKLILLSLADRADENNTCYPSISRLEYDTEMNRKTIMAGVSYLADIGLINVFQSSGRGNIYQLIGVENRHETSTKKGTSTEIDTSAKKGTAPVPKVGQVPVPKKGLHQYQNRDTNLSRTNQLNQSINQSNKNKAEKPKKPDVNIPPNFDDLKNYCLEVGGKVDPEAFMDFYQANGWVVGKAKAKMKDWKAVVRTWMRNDLNRNPVPGRYTPTTEDIYADF